MFSIRCSMKQLLNSWSRFSRLTGYIM